VSNPHASTSGPIYSELAESDPSFAEIVELFIESLPERLSAMQQAFEKNDIDALGRLTHQLKGAGAGHGYPCLTEKAAELEQQVKESALGDVGTGLTQLSELVSRVKVLPPD